MYKKKIAFITTLIFMMTSCGGTWDSVKRGLTGGKKKSTDEFLVKKKDPLIFPPSYESLPTPEERATAVDERSKLEKLIIKDDGPGFNEKNIEQKVARTMFFL